MAALFYIRLISLTAGTIVYLFLLALILGHRRPRKFERLLFLLVLSLFLMYAGGLLEINGRIQYGSLPDATRLLSTILFDLGAFFLLPLIWHTHVEYARAVQRARVKPVLWAGVWLMYLIALGELVGVVVSHVGGKPFGGALLSFAGFNPLGGLAICAGCCRRSAMGPHAPRAKSEYKDTWEVAPLNLIAALRHAHSPHSLRGCFALPL